MSVIGSTAYLAPLIVGSFMGYLVGAWLAIGGGWLLIECPFSPVATGLQALVGTLQDQGYRILLAHPERCPNRCRCRACRDPD